MRRAWLLPVLAVMAIGGATAIALTQGEEPEQVDELQEAQQAGERAGSAGEEIVANLERIEAHLSKGAGLSEKSDEIRALTTRQAKSLEKLVKLLREQLETLRRSKETLEATERTATGLGRLGEQQLAVIEETLAALKDLESSTRFATRASGEMSRLALYGARLAEDSQKKFEGGP